MWIQLAVQCGESVKYHVKTIFYFLLTLRDENKASKRSSQPGYQTYQSTMYIERLVLFFYILIHLYS